MGYKIAFDPGLTKTGYCVFRDGRVVDCATLRPDKADKTFLEKLLSLKRKTESLLSIYQSLGYGKLDIIGVESWNPWDLGMNREAMKKCSAVRGMLLTLADNYGVIVREINKGKASKDEAELLAKQFKVKGSKDAKDALHLGICAGFDR